MPILLAVAAIALLAAIVAGSGNVVGPAIFAVGFAIWGLLCIFSGGNVALFLIGFLYVGLAGVELAAARRFWDTRGAQVGPPTRWRVTAALVGLAGSTGILVVLWAIMAFLAWISSL